MECVRVCGFFREEHPGITYEYLQGSEFALYISTSQPCCRSD